MFQSVMRLLLVPVFYFCLTGLLWVTLSDRIALPESLGEIVPWLRSFEQWAWAVAMAVVIGDVLLPSLPSSPALIGLGVIYGPWLGGILGGVACTAAGMLAFGMARALGRERAAYVIPERELERIERVYERWGVGAVALGRALGGPGAWLIFMAGLGGMPMSRVVPAIMAGAFSASFVHSVLGDVAVERPLVALGIVLVLVAAVAVGGKRMIGNYGR